MRTRDAWQAITVLASFLSAEHLEFAEVTDDTGRVILNLVDSLLVGCPSRNPLVKTAIVDSSSGHGLILANRELYLAATAPIFAEGRVIGAITIGKALDQEMLSRLGSSFGIRLAVWRDPLEKALLPLGDQSLPSVSSLLKKTDFDRLAKGDPIIKLFKIDGDPYQASFFLQDGAGGQEKFICAAYRSMKFLSAAGTLTLIHFGAIFLLVLILVFQFAWWISQRVTDPLLKLTRTARRMAALDFTERIPVSGRDEVSELAKSFNHLAFELQANIEQKDKFAAELAGMNENLGHLIAERTEELVHANLRLQQAMTEKDDLLRAVSHDLGAPLRNIGGLAHLLEQKHSDELDAEGKEKVARIISNVRSELQLIDQLLEISRIKTRGGRPSRIDLPDLLSQIRQDFSFFLEEKKITMTVTDVLPTIWVERNRIRQLFQNLIDNAIKYMRDQPEPRIEIGWIEEEKIHLFWISDNGMGIPPEQKDKIFCVFRRVKSREAAQIEGKGIGLAVVKSIVEVLGGEIWVESKPGVGSTFYFTMDRALVDGESLTIPDSTTDQEPADLLV